MYKLEIDKYELTTLKSLLKAEYKKLSDVMKNYSGFDRDMLEDSKFRLLLLIGKLDNIIIMGDKIWVGWENLLF